MSAVIEGHACAAVIQQEWPYSEWSSTTVPAIERQLADLEDTCAAISPLLQLLELDLSRIGSVEANGAEYVPMTCYSRGGVQRAVRLLVDRQHELLESIARRVCQKGGRG